MSNVLSKIIFKTIGWKNVGYNPEDLDKFVAIVVPHTSNWDFPLGLLSRSSWGLDIKFVGKKEMFKWPLGGLMKWLGGYPVDRSKSTNFVSAVVKILKEKEKIAICIAPEGTRKKVKKLKRGFYYMAKGAGIPLVFITFDYGTKEIRWSEPYMPTDDEDVDMQYIYDHFAGVKGKNSDKSFDAVYIPRKNIKT